MITEQQLEKQVRYLMYLNIKAGISPFLKTKYCYVMPSPGNYPFQWWWDTFFNIFILCSLNDEGDLELAKRNFETLFKMQKEDGFVGHMIFWENLFPKSLLNIFQGPPKINQVRPHMSSLIQPPLAAQALHCIYRCSNDRLFLHEMMPFLKKYLDWLIRNRDFDGDGLLSIISPFESGIDWKPSFDEVLGQPPGQGSEQLFRKVMRVERKNFFHGYNYTRIARANVFIVKEVLFNTLFVLDLRALAALCDEIGDADAEKYRQHAIKVSRRIMEIMYSKEDAAFFDVKGKSNKQLKSLTFTIGVPLLLDEMNEQEGREILRRHFLNTEEFNLEFPIPSVAKNNPAFSPTESKFLWRGPTWIPANWWMQQCFLKYGMMEEAQHLADISVSLIEKSGFREYYNPFTGEGYGARDFTWGALALDMVRRKGRSEK